MAPLFRILGFLAIGSMVNAMPAPQLAPSLTLTEALAPTGTAAAPPPPAGTPAEPEKKISIPDDVIASAPVVDTPPETGAVSIPGGDNSTLLEARPGLQEYVDTATNITTNTTSPEKRGLDGALNKRIPNPANCDLKITPVLTKETWYRLANRVCNIWYPDPSVFQYDPAKPLPQYHKSTKFGPINVGGGQVVTVDFSYGVEDWGLLAAYSWQVFYVPQSRDICVADLTTLIDEMTDPLSGCLYPTGYDTSNDPYGTHQPKWYTFVAS